MSINATIISPNLNTLLQPSISSTIANTQQILTNETPNQNLNISSKTTLNNIINILFEPLESLINISKTENSLKEFLNFIPKLDKNLSVQLSQFTEKILDKFSLSHLLDKNTQSKIDTLPLQSMESFLIKEDENTTHWKMILFPILDNEKILPLKFYYRHTHKEDFQQDKDPDNKNNKKTTKKNIQTRFVAEFNLSEIGLVQFDGLIDPKTFSLYLRSQTNFPEDIQKDIQSLFKSILTASTKNGDLVFETHKQLPQIATIEDKNDQRPLLI
ncbi:MAG: hypothetical protein Q8L85_10150 [Alphaproteobacteria bacterium]|nr:hypothetical protein [Alphaproteobacteria bacterium]